MMTQHDIEVARMMAEAWRLNDERNKRIEAEKRLVQSEYRDVDDAPQE